VQSCLCDHYVHALMHYMHALIVKHSCMDPTPLTIAAAQSSSATRTHAYTSFQFIRALSVQMRFYYGVGTSCRVCRVRPMLHSVSVRLFSVSATGSVPAVHNEVRWVL
jgi:hypothetical protein